VSLCVVCVQSGFIEFREFVHAISVTSRGNMDEKLNCKFTATCLVITAVYCLSFTKNFSSNILCPHYIRTVIVFLFIVSCKNPLLSHFNISSVFL